MVGAAGVGVELQLRGLGVLDGSRRTSATYDWRQGACSVILWSVNARNAFLDELQ